MPRRIADLSQSREALIAGLVASTRKMDAVMDGGVAYFLDLAEAAAFRQRAQERGYAPHLWNDYGYVLVARVATYNEMYPVQSQPLDDDAAEDFVQPYGDIEGWII